MSNRMYPRCGGMYFASGGSEAVYFAIPTVVSLPFHHVLQSAFCAAYEWRRKYTCEDGDLEHTDTLNVKQFDVKCLSRKVIF